MYGGGVPPGHAQGHVLGVHHPVPHPPTTPATCRTAAAARGTDLWAQAGSQGPGGRRAGRLRRPALLYLRPFSPGSQNPLKAGSANDWIGSRSRPARGGPSVQDVVGLTLGCASLGFGTGRGRDGTRTGTGRDGRTDRRVGPPEPNIVRRKQQLAAAMTNGAANQNRLKPVLMAVQHYLVRPERPNTLVIYRALWPQSGRKDAILHYPGSVFRDGTRRDGTGTGRERDGTERDGRGLVI